MNLARVTALTLVFTCLGTLALAQQENRQQDRQQNRGQGPYDRYFTVPGVEFSEEQQAQVDKIKQEFLPKIEETQRKWDGVITDEQQQARRAAFEKARSEGKQGRELFAAADAAVKLSQAQLDERVKIREERTKLLEQVRDQLLALLTDEQRPVARQRPPRQQVSIPPTHANVKYGPHERNVMDVWLAKSDKPTPVLFSIHGGGFRAGDKGVGEGILAQCLDAGISVVAITYRYSSQAIAPAAFLDSARAVQFTRHQAKEWNIDPTRFAASGGSAGAGISLWLAFHDDLADPDNADPVLRESTRLSCAMVSAGQTSYDPRFIRKLIPEADTYKHSALAQLYDVDLDQLDNLPEEKYRLMEEVSSINHLTKDDVPVMLGYGGGLDQEITDAGVGIHHARFGKALKEKMDPLGIECLVYAGGETLGGGERIWQIDFLKKNFKMTD